MAINESDSVSSEQRASVASSAPASITWPPQRGPLGYPLAHYHLGRSVYWGHWGIDFSEQQPDESKNFGVKVAHLPFGVGARGPIDGFVGSPIRKSLEAACAAWVERGELPAGAIKEAA